MKDSKLAIIFVAITVALLGVAVIFRSEAEVSRGSDSGDIDLPFPIDDSPLEPEEEPIEPIDPQPDTDKQVAGEVEGIVTEIFEDCSRRRVFENGQVVEKNDAITCDGGSYIVVDDFTINTVSGFVPQELSFFYDIGDLEPGERVSAKYQIDSFGQPNFECDECGIEKL